MYELDFSLLQLLNGTSSAILDQMMLVLTNGFTWIPFYIAMFVMVMKNNESMSQIMVVVGCCVFGVMLTAGIDNLFVKPWVARPRPAQDMFVKYAIDVVDGYRERGFSFFSAHAANTFCVAMYMMLLVRNRAFTVTMLGWSLLNCYTRLYLGVHYPSDVFFGILFGALMGTIAYRIHLRIYYKITPHFRYISEAYTKTGYSIGDLDIVIATMVFTLLYAVFRTLLLQV